jgi:xylulokinase
MIKNIVIAHDIGTSGLKSALVESNGQILANTTCPYPMLTPNPGWAEQEPSDYWNAVVINTKRLLQKIDKSRILGIVFTSQSMGIIPVDIDGNVLHRNISWVDGRAEEQAQWMMKILGGRSAFKSLIGIEITGKDVIPKLRWLKQNKPEIYRQTYRILDVNGYLRFKATGKMAAEWSGASTWGFNLKKKDWEYKYFRWGGIDKQKLPELIRSTDVAGTLTPEAADELNLPTNTPVYGGCDDSQGAALGAGCIHDGAVFAYIGTAAQFGVISDKNLKFRNGAACIQSADPNKNLLIGVTETAGNNVDWLIEKFFKEDLERVGKEGIYDILSNEANKVAAGSDYLIFTPWFMGERYPVSSTTTRGTIFNLSMEHTRGHLIRALFEGIGYNIRWTMENLERDYKFKIPEFRFVGGGSKNSLWMQTIADITGRKVNTTYHPTMAGAIGAAICAFVGSGLLKSFYEADRIISTKKTFSPNPNNRKIYDELFVNYQDVFYSLKETYKRANSKRFN